MWIDVWNGTDFASPHSEGRLVWDGNAIVVEPSQGGPLAEREHLLRLADELDGSSEEAAHRSMLEMEQKYGWGSYMWVVFHEEESEREEERV